MAKNTTTTTIRLNDAEKAILQNKATENNIGLSTYIKQAALGYEIKQKPLVIYKKTDPALIRQIAWAGNNLNRIAYVINSLDELTASERFTLSVLLEDIGDQLRSIQNGDF